MILRNPFSSIFLLSIKLKGTFLKNHVALTGRQQFYDEYGSSHTVYGSAMLTVRLAGESFGVALSHHSSLVVLL